MPVLDHFHPPLSDRRGWEGFHGLWAATLVEQLNTGALAEEFFADMQVHIGGPVQVDIAALRDPDVTANGHPPHETAAPGWTPPPTDLIIPTMFPDEVEVQVWSTVSGAELVGAIELVSPANKDRPETRTAFAAKCVAYLTRGIGLIVVDVVTNRRANLHNLIMDMLGQASEPFTLTETAGMYVVAYRPSRQQTGDRIELWPFTLGTGDPLPVVPLGLRNAATVPVDLESAYTQARQRGRFG